MSVYYELEPLDTLFFRGSIPMEAGMQNVVSLFPPPPSVLNGAFWTAVCLKTSNAANGSNIFGDKSDMPNATAFLLKKDNRFYVPAPATWYYDYDGSEKIKSGKCLAEKSATLIVAEKLSSKKPGDFKCDTSANDVTFVKAEKEANSMSDCWIEIEFLKSKSNGSVFSENSVLMKNDIYDMENRTGIGLDFNRHTIEGQLYTSTHIRLRQEITMIVCFDREDKLDGLGNSGKLTLGGEKRIVRYRKLNKKEADMINGLSCDSKKESNQYLSLMPIEAKENLCHIIASGKLFVTSGWDMAKGFHKPSVSWIPAGAVFNSKINNSCIPLGESKQ